MSVQAFGTLVVEDSRRLLIRRAVFATLWASGLFVALAATKEVKPVYNHAPWLNDPYDTFVSFTMFFVPLLVGCLLVQVSLCLRSEPLSVRRVVVILRACRVAVAVMSIELASAGVAVVVGANRSVWTAASTGVEVGLLCAATAFTIRAIIRLLRVPRLPSPADDDVPDWLGDAVAVARREGRWLGPS